MTSCDTQAQCRVQKIGCHWFTDFIIVMCILRGCVMDTIVPGTTLRTKYDGDTTRTWCKERESQSHSATPHPDVRVQTKIWDKRENSCRQNYCRGMVNSHWREYWSSRIHSQRAWIFKVKHYALIFYFHRNICLENMQFTSSFLIASCFDRKIS